MRRYFAILALFTLLIPLVLVSILHTPNALAEDGENSTKISGLLALQVEAKLRALEPMALEEGQVDILKGMQAMGMKVGDMNNQRIFIHLDQPPNQSQIEELESIGLTLYLDSWIPPTGNHPQGFIVADMPIDTLEGVASKDYVVRLDSAERVLEPQNDLATQKINADDVWNLGYTGSGVKIAVLDSGLDTNHPDIPPPIASKDYSNWPTLDDTIANTVTGHGTHVTGSALGRGTNSGGQYRGVAPGADLIFLKIGNDTDGNASTAAIVAALKAAVDIYDADIITMSYGGWGQYHDGSSPEAQAVDYASSKGAVVFISAGNDAAGDEHYSGTVAANSTTDFIQVNVTSNPFSLLFFNLVWYDGLGTHNELELHYYDSSYNELTNINAGAQSESSRGTEAVDYFVLLSGSTYYLKAENNSTTSQLFHIYVIPFIGSATFQNPDPFYTIISPADADSAIAVGAYTTRLGWTDYEGNSYDNLFGLTVNTVASFSSRGPRVDSNASLKPNIVAPGSAIISCRDTDVYAWPNPNDDPFIIDNDGLNLDGSGPADYYVMQGTSMASPMAAGAAALLLQAQPELKGNPAAVRDRLQQTASQAGSPDYIWGYGLIDIHQAVTGLFDPWGYDTNNNDIIDKAEAVNAVNDYFAGLITKAQVIEVVVLYFFG